MRSTSGQTDFPEDKEDQQINRHENAEHPGLEEQEQHHVRLDAIRNTNEARMASGVNKVVKRTIVNERPFHSQMQGGANGRIPSVLFLELETRRVGFELSPQVDGKSKRDQGATNANQRRSLASSFGRKSITAPTLPG